MLVIFVNQQFGDQETTDEKENSYAETLQSIFGLH